MGGLFKKKMTADEAMLMFGREAFGNAVPQSGMVIKAAENAEKKIDEEQALGIEFELVVFRWLALMRKSFNIEERQALDGVITRNLPIFIKELADTPRMGLLRRGARWLYRVNDEGTAARLWVSVNVDDLPEGVWHDFSLQVLTRLFAHLTTLSSGEPMDRLLTTLGDQAAIRIFPRLSDSPFNLQNDLKKAVANAIGEILEVERSKARR